MSKEQLSTIEKPLAGVIKRMANITIGPLYLGSPAPGRNRNFQEQLEKVVKELQKKPIEKALKKVGEWWISQGFKELILGGSWNKISFTKSSLYKKMFSLELLARTGDRKSTRLNSSH